MSAMTMKLGGEKGHAPAMHRHCHWRYGVLLLMLLAGSLGYAAIAHAGNAERPSALATLFLWTPFILQGFGLNLLMSFIAMAMATVQGVILGLLQINRFRPVRIMAWLVTQVFRNSPWLVILFVIMYAIPFEVRLPGLGRTVIPGWLPATLAFSLPVMANISEIVRGAVNSIPKSQWESAESLALTRMQTLRWVILPQCIKRSIPPWMNWYALLALATPMASILGVHEAVGNAQAAMQAAGSRPELLIPFYSFLLLLFFAYIYPIALYTRRLEKKYGFTS